MTDLRQSPQYGKYLQAIGWEAARLNRCQVFIKKIPFSPFSIIKIQRPEPPLPWLKINQLVRARRSFLVKLEPLAASEVPPRYRQDSWPLLPTKTVQIDLTKTEKQLWQAINKKTRNCIKKAQFNNSTRNYFYQNFKKFGKGDVPQEKAFQALMAAFGQNAWLLTVHPPAGGSAGALILIHDQTAYYYYAFTSPAGRRIFGQHLLVWEAIKRAKKAGCRIFDFEGIADRRYRFTRQWQGFSHFKKSFGGQEITYPGSFSRWRLPI